MIGDLFGNAPPPPKPKPEPKPEPKFKPGFERDGKSLHFVHPCSRCGSKYAPWGYKVNLRQAMKTKDVAEAGTWYCTGCKPR